MAVTINRQILTLEGVTGNTVSDIVPDEVNGGFVRKLYFYTEPTNATNRRPDIELTLTALTEEALKLLTPELKY